MKAVAAMHPMLEFGEALADGGDLECGETWSLEHGWRTYMRTGTKVLMLPPRAMRRLGEKYRDHPNATHEVIDLGNTMIECANAAKEKRDRGVIPDGAVEFIPHVGRS